MVALLFACAGEPTRAPVETRSGGAKREQARPSVYRVSGGDTLYSIAWRYGMDFRVLARINSIPAPYTIHPGQQLRLAGDSARPGARSPTPTKARTKVQPSTRPKIQSKTQAKTQAPVASTGSTVGATSAGKTVTSANKTATSANKTATSARKTATGAKKTARTKAPPAQSPPKKSKTAVNTVWWWPTKGKVIREFSGTVHKGIDIDGKAGDAVRATATGEVVYAGAGIVGYGNLLIVKHDAVYLSAYGHNRKLLAKEGDQVSAGQRIAEKGSSATNSVKLHFEIRREGKPVNPRKLLPTR